jgi:leucyl aminopeptidase
MAAQLAQPRLLHVFGEPAAKWMTEGDKLRLKRQGKKFADITDHQEFYGQDLSAMAGEARVFANYLLLLRLIVVTDTPGADLPKLSHQRFVKPIFHHVSQRRIKDVLRHMTSYYTRYFDSITGEHSAMWLHDHIADVRPAQPSQTHPAV